MISTIKLVDFGEFALPVPNASERYFNMPIKKPTDLKSVSIGQITDLEGKVVVGGAGAGTVSASKSGRDLKKMEKTLEDLDKNPTPESGSSSGSASKKFDSDQAKRTADGQEDGPDGVPDGFPRP